ncbi:hypothetical protein BKA69DRAFT_1097209 [Paraphysoderma sedebokerense]|nr:hypothetical protein BKA69DRAFT_1097209 [Paraphysoderma sedebokerense]
MTKLSAFFIPVLAISLFLAEQPVKVDAANPEEMLPQGRGLHDGGLSMRDLWEDPWSLTRRMPSIMDWMQRTSTFHMKEIDNEFIAFVDCPGFKREDINVSLEGNNYLTVTARKHCSEKDKFCINRDVFQQFRVGEEVNTENISVS